MAFTDSDIQKIKDELDILMEQLRPEVSLREKLDYRYEIDAQTASVVIIEVRPHFIEPLLKTTMPIIKAKYNKGREIWGIYWERANGKWEKYPEEPEVSNLRQFFRVLHEDKLGCFFG